MIVLPGPSALLPAQRDALVRSLPSIKSLDAIFIHFVEPTSPESPVLEPASRERAVLDSLLRYGDDSASQPSRDRLQAAISSADARASGILFVAPRGGTISPWSSKATDIAKMCKLESHVRRIERGIAFVLEPPTCTLSTLPEGERFRLYDRMTQSIAETLPPAAALFERGATRPLKSIGIVGGEEDAARAKLVAANSELGLALAPDELDYLVRSFLVASDVNQRDPTDAELFMFAQVNSEHCRHKIFNADWTIGGKEKENSLFGMIRNTHKLHPEHTISAYSDNAAVIEGSPAMRFTVVEGESGNVYRPTDAQVDILIKVETHNHPTAVSPFPGAATGSGGEIRDEGAVGRGSRPKAGMCGFTVSNLLIPGFHQKWETDFGKPAHIASALDIMTEGPLGASGFNNEFGRPGLTGYFRTFAQRVGAHVRGYHKPIMLAGGLGNIEPRFAIKGRITAGSRLIVLGGPGMLIGLGGGAASSMASGASTAALDFASVQRDNPEMQRRCQQVIDSCVALGDSNPIQSIHDVGAGGLSNALPELVHDSDLGGTFEIRKVLVDDPSMSPMEIWCNESQERYVLAVATDNLETFERIAQRERCPFAVVGVATDVQELRVTDSLLGQDAIRLPMDVLFGKPPKMSRKSAPYAPQIDTFDTSLTSYLPSGQASASHALEEAAFRVMRLPSVASKSFLITIGDRTVTGLVTRDQMVGPWQVPVADVAVTQSSYGFEHRSGEAMAVGERTPAALLSPSASARMAVAESLTNLVAAATISLGRIKLSANWMCAASFEQEGAALYEAVQAIGLDLCPALGVSIPVGKDSMSMSMRWTANDGPQQVTAPLSVIITAFTAVSDVTKTWTPDLKTCATPSRLLLVDLAGGKQRMGASALAQTFSCVGDEAADVESPEVLKAFLLATQDLHSAPDDVVLAYHDRSDGGLFTTLAEMCFAGRLGASVSLDSITADSADIIPALFNEELGAVFQVSSAHLDRIKRAFTDAGVPASSLHDLGEVDSDRSKQVLRFSRGGHDVWSCDRARLQSAWAETSFQMQTRRDNPETAAQEFENITNANDGGLFYDLAFAPAPLSLPKLTSLDDRPRVAILREQGVNGHVEMAWAFAAAGFAAVDVHMSDVIRGVVTLDDFKGVAACGGFSYGDVLGAGSGWAKSIMLNARARDEFDRFLNSRSDTFALGVCNGCQMLSSLRSLVPQMGDWPDFKPNMSGRFEARVCMVEVDSPSTTPSVFLRGMHGSRFPIAVAHGEGRVDWPASATARASSCVRYIDPSTREPTQRYPYNPNGSVEGATGFQALDGRVFALMPHPERVVTLSSNSWHPSDVRDSWQGRGPWMRMFENARLWIG